MENRQVVLLKSLRTNNRFYALVNPESGLKNADAIADFPPDLLLGIAYPCLEDGLNDFAVIRTTFETIDVFPDDEELRAEMLDIIADARSNLTRRLTELRDKIVAGQAHFLGTDLNEFRDYVLHMATKGTIRRTLDSMMKVDVFESVSTTTANLRQSMPDPMYHYEFLPEHHLSLIRDLPPRVFIGRLFEDVLASVVNDENYQGKYTFDRNVFQKFIAVMFINYATTDPMFYGTSREDYGVSSDKDMNDTPLYQAVKAAIRDLENGVEWSNAGRNISRPFSLPGLAAAPPAGPAPTSAAPPQPSAATQPPSEAAPTDDLSALFEAEPNLEDLFATPFNGATHSVEIPLGAVENKIIKPLTLLAEAVRLLRNMDHPRAAEISSLATSAGKELFRNLQELQIVSPLANDPLE